jgi:hypothetical protein
VNIFKRLIPPSPRDQTAPINQLSRKAYSSSFTQHSATISRNSPKSSFQNENNLRTSEDNQPILLTTLKGGIRRTSVTSSECSSKRSGSHQKSNMRYSKCDEDDNDEYGEEILEEPLLGLIQ